MRKRCALLALTAVTAFASPRAAACSDDLPGPSAIAPNVDGRVDMPLNPVFVGPTANLGPAWIRREGAAPDRMDTESAHGVTRITPPTRLVEVTRYEVFLNEPGDKEPPKAEHAPTFAFTTRADDDGTAPDVPVVLSSTVDDAWHGADTCNGRILWEKAAKVRIELAIADEAAFALIRDTHTDEAAGEDVVAFAFPPRDDDTVMIVDVTTKSDNVDYSVIAFDDAGNQSFATVVPLDLGCRGGCTSGSAPSLWGLALLLGLRTSRRRARARRGEGTLRP